MRLTKNKLIDIVSGTFNDPQFKIAINKRFIFGLNANPLKSDQVFALNFLIRQIDNPMLYGYEFSCDMFEYTFDKYMYRLLYVSGKWESLFHYYLLANFDFNKCKMHYKELETFAYIIYFFNNMALRIHVDDQKMSIKIEQISYQEKEF